jgi:hypothetical protein
MRGLYSCFAAAYAAVIATCLLVAAPTMAQVASPPTITESPATDVRTRSSESQHRSMLGDVFSRVANDPTTYALPPIIYTAHRLDWDSSQKLFARGYVEANPGFTVSGRVNDTPISWTAGKRRILGYSAAMIGRSALNNGVCALVEGRLIERSPQHRTFIRTLGWIERGFITSYWAFRMSHNQFGQWRENERMLSALPPPAASASPAVP